MAVLVCGPKELKFGLNILLFQVKQVLRGAVGPRGAVRGGWRDPQLGWLVCFFLLTLSSDCTRFSRN